LILLAGCEKEENDKDKEKEFEFDFSTGYDGWIGGFSDHADTSTADYNLEFIRTRLPAPLDTTKMALKIGGTNRSDDLFMFIKRKFAGLEPNENYEIEFEIQFASNVPTNQIGVGGPPDAVMLKAGAVLYEPLSILNTTEGIYRMNIDHGLQMNEGKDMINLGTIGVSDTTTQYTLVTKKNKSKPFKIKTNSSGELWVIIGTDSGFESRTELYYNKIKIKFDD
ncbi:MAG: hypothetical protein NZ522_02785, partial [Chitinophagales bacterium]|nr:hypothetical protein [Chitinophagales bacterium]